MNTVKLVEGQKYYFYEKSPRHGDEQVCRATYLKTLTNGGYSYLIKRRYEASLNENILVYTPINWFCKAETLEDVLSRTTNLPTDVMRIIEQYL